jgi:hypothetical protein
VGRAGRGPIELGDFRELPARHGQRREHLGIIVVRVLIPESTG